MMCKGKMTEAQKKLAEENMGLIFHVLKSCGLASVDNYSEYYGAAAEGLCKAAKSFDETKGVKFASYAVKCIMNEVRMQIRKNSKAARNGFAVLSLNSEVPGLELCLEDMLASESDMQKEVEESEVVRKVCATLKERYNKKSSGCNRYKVFEMLFVEKLSQVEVAKSLGVSQSYVSRMSSQIREDFEKFMRIESKNKLR